jgi:hypothetical protein
MITIADTKEVVAGIGDEDLVRFSSIRTLNDILIQLDRPINRNIRKAAG